MLQNISKTVSAARAPFGKVLKVGYVLKRFPRFSETFILNEILELERLGVEVQIFSLLRPPKEARQPRLELLRAKVTYLPQGGALEKWRIRHADDGAGTSGAQVTELVDQHGLPFAEILKGKTPEEACLLYLKATTVAILASSEGLDHLHAHFASDATTVALLASRMSRIPYSFTAHARDIYHTYVDEKADAATRRRKIAEAAFVVTVSDFNRRHLINLAGIGSEAKIHRLYNGIDLTCFHPGATSRRPNLFIGIGRLVEKKGFRDLVEACRLLSQRGRDFRCLIIGEGPERSALAQQIDQADMSAKICLEGAKPQEELITILNRAAAVVLPAVVCASGDRDGLPTVLLESLAMGLPAISTTVSGIPEIIDHGRSGLLVPPNSPEAVADALETLLADPALCQHMGEAGRRKAERDFDLRTNVARLHRYFDDVASPAVALEIAR